MINRTMQMPTIKIMLYQLTNHFQTQNLQLQRETSGAAAHGDPTHKIVAMEESTNSADQ